ncbi:MAG: methyltransferase domain-containing protein [Planctomycetes bacterium]|nr:methyltransferase domain-containing protein [Planctomycetota bacterium]
MGDVNQKIFLKKMIPEVEGPIIEIGSKDYGNTSSFRDFYTGNEYIGTDQEAGKGVDVVIDLMTTIHPLKENYFELGISCSVLEHCSKPWIMADNISRLIKQNGKLYLSIPWVWRYHPYPDDYYRFSYKAIPILFSGFQWGDSYYSTNVEEEIFRIDGGGGSISRS